MSANCCDPPILSLVVITHYNKSMRVPLHAGGHSGFRTGGSLPPSGANGRREHDQLETDKPQGEIRVAADVPCTSASRWLFRS